MKKDNPQQDEDINLIKIIEELWIGKLIIIIFIILFTLGGYYYASSKPNQYNISSPFWYGKSSAFIDFIPINDILKENELYLSRDNPNGYKIDSNSVFDMFVNEFNDYDEITTILQEDEYVKEELKNLTNYEKEEELLEFAKSFQILKSKDRSGLLISADFSIDWHNAEVGIIILNKSLDLILTNLKQNLINDIEKIATFIDLKNQREVEGLRVALQIIEEQSALYNTNAKIQELLMASDYFEIKERILSFEGDFSSSHLRTALNVIKNFNKADLIDYNTLIATKKSQNNMSRDLSLSIILGLIIGTLYVLTQNSIRNRKIK